MLTTQNQQAHTFAQRAHAGQQYSDGVPYMRHVEAVAQRCLRYGDLAVTVAFLHDVAEDTNATLADVERAFGPFVAECVGFVTDVPGRNRHERKKATNAKLIKVRPSHYAALVAKAADRLCNIAACIVSGDKRLAMYRAEHEDFREAAFAEKVCDPLWDEMDALLSLGQPVPAGPTSL